MLLGTSVGLEAVAEVELRGLALRLLEEAGVHAVERLAVTVVRALDRGAALGQRQAGHLHAAVAVPSALRLLEQRDVDLAPEDLVHAAHVAGAGLLVVVEIEVLATRGDATGRMHHAVAERAALAALVGFCCARCARHPVSVAAEPNELGHDARRALEL